MRAPKAFIWVLAGVAALLLLGLLGSAFFRSVRAPGLWPIPLAMYYNAGLTNSPLNPYYNLDKNNLASFPTGTNHFGKIPFQVGGIIQLANRDYRKWRTPFPQGVTNMAVGSRCKALHLLHGTGFNAGGSRTVIAYLELHYEDDTTAKIPIAYGRHVHDWWFGQELTEALDPGSEIAWRGTNPESARKGQRLRIFKSTFPNPHPAKRIDTIDYVSTLSPCAPFILGLTFER